MSIYHVYYNYRIKCDLFIHNNKIRILEVVNLATFKAKEGTAAPSVKAVTKSKTYQELSLDDLLALQGTLSFLLYNNKII